MENILAWVSALDTTIAALMVSGLIWRWKNHLTRRQKLRDSLREHRIILYKAVLDPYIRALYPEKIRQKERKHKYSGEKGRREPLKEMQSTEYMLHCWNLTLLGADDVVLAHNKLKQHFFHQRNFDDEQKNLEGVLLLGELLLAIRRSMGNEGTKLNVRNIWEGLIRDPETLEPLRKMRRRK